MVRSSVSPASGPLLSRLVANSKAFSMTSCLTFDKRNWKVSVCTIKYPSFQWNLVQQNTYLMFYFCYWYIYWYMCLDTFILVT